MATIVQISANRINGQLGGVKTEEGREKVKYNALKHGLLSLHLTDFDKEIFEGMYQQVREELKPEGVIQEILVERYCIYYVKLF